MDIEQRSGRHERLFVRVVRAGTETLFVTMPPEWSDFDISSLAGRSGPWEQAPSGSRNARLEVASARLLDGTLLQVGKSTESREELLAGFRYIVALVSIAIVLIGLAGGILVTRRMLRADSSADCRRAPASPRPAIPKRGCRWATIATPSTS